MKNTISQLWHWGGMVLFPNKSCNSITLTADTKTTNTARLLLVYYINGVEYIKFIVINDENTQTIVTSFEEPTLIQRIEIRTTNPLNDSVVTYLDNIRIQLQ